jgi:DNA-binding HxlR family transcriptional regulator
MERNRGIVGSHPDRSRLLDERTCAALELLENRWTLRLLTVLVTGPARFSELEAAVPGVSRRMMTERLRELEGAGVVRRTVDPGPPITSTYALTDDGQGLGPILEQVAIWAASRPERAAS